MPVCPNELVGQAFSSGKTRRSVLVCLKNHLHSMYAPHLLYASEADYSEPNVEQEPKSENRPIIDICTELLNEIRKLVASQIAKVDTEPELDEPESEIVDELDLES